jgi:hypothetical protein
MTCLNDTAQMVQALFSEQAVLERRHNRKDPSHGSPAPRAVGLGHITLQDGVHPAKGTACSAGHAVTLRLGLAQLSVVTRSLLSS